MPHITLHTLITADQATVFDLARSIDLHTTSLEHTNERAIAGRTSGLIELGESVTWRARHFGIYQTLTAVVTEMDRPHYFVDEMQEGVFARFRHRHSFVQRGAQTIMTDTFDYTAPLGPLGRLADWLFLTTYMRRLLEQRNVHLKAQAEAAVK